MKPHISIPYKARQQICVLLTQLLADEYILHTKTRNAHWNIIGPDFHPMHGFFEQQYDQLAEAIDDIAERIRALGHPAPGSLAEMLKHARLAELPGGTHMSAKFIAVLLKDHETIIRELRENAYLCAKLGDDGTNDFVVGLMEQHEKMAWMLRASVS